MTHGRTGFDSLVRWPADADGWRRTLLVGALLAAMLPLVVPSALLAGYAVRVLRADADDPAPSFTDLRSLAATGARATGIVVAYHLPVVVLAGAVAAVGLGGSVTTFVHGGPPTAFRPAVRAALGPTAALSKLLVAAAVMLPVCGYLATIGVTAYAATDAVGAAFDPVRIRRRAWSKATLRAWLLGSLVTVGTGVVVFLVAAIATPIPGVGRIGVGAVRFYGGTVALRLWSVRRPADDGGASTATKPGVGSTPESDPA